MNKQKRSKRKQACYLLPVKLIDQVKNRADQERGSTGLPVYPAHVVINALTQYLQQPAQAH